MTIEQLKADMKDLLSKETTLEAREGALETKEKTDLAAIKATVDDLRLKVATGIPISQADLTALDTQVTGLTAGLTTVIDKLDTVGTDLDTAEADAAGTGAVEPPPAGTPQPLPPGSAGGSGPIV